MTRPPTRSPRSRARRVARPTPNRVERARADGRRPVQLVGVPRSSPVTGTQLVGDRLAHLRRLGQVAATAQDAPALALGRATPDAVLDAMQRARTRGTRSAPRIRRRCAARSRRPCRRTGKNSVGFAPRHRPCCIHAYSSGVSVTSTLPPTDGTSAEFPGFIMLPIPRCTCKQTTHMEVVLGVMERADYSANSQLQAERRSTSSTLQVLTQ